MSQASESGTGNFRGTAESVGRNIREMGSQVRQTAQEKIEQMRQQASEYYEQGRERAREIQQNLEGYVQEKPIKALLIAGGIGLLLGVLWKRR
jgi:ElaB/YqjD/DUF883 family membrane-anchored ribosome-binding protein